MIFACSATLLPPTWDGKEPTDTADHIRLFFGGGDGNVGTAVIRVESQQGPEPPAPETNVPKVTLRDGHEMPRVAVSLPMDIDDAKQSINAAFEEGGRTVN